MRQKHVSGALLLVVASVLNASAAALNVSAAAWEGAEDSDSLKVQQLEQVVVSTPKEHADLSRQPVSATTLSAHQLHQKAIEDVKDLSFHVPGLFIPDYGSHLTTSVYLRGIGSRIGTPAVGMYVDNIPLADMSSMDQDLSDAERIEVLRGPQGTLYGQNTMGGLIRVYTKNPFHYQGTDVRLGYGTYGDWRAAATHYHRPSERLAFSGGVSYHHQGGFFRNEALDGKKVDSGDDLALRWRGIYRPSERVKLDLSVRYQWTDQGGYPYEATDGADAGTVAYNRPSTYKRHLVNAGLHAEHRFRRMDFTSSTGFQYMTDDMLLDQDFSRLDIYTLGQQQQSKMLSQELALKSKADRRWQWTTGASLQCQWLTTDAPVTFYQDGLEWLSETITSNATQHMPTVQAGPMQMRFRFCDRLQALDVTPTTEGAPFLTHFNSPVQTIGIFHQSTLSDLLGAKGLNLVLGIRLDYQHTGLDYDASFAMQHVYGLSGELSGSVSRTIDMVPATQFDLRDRLLGNLSHHSFQYMPHVSLQYAWGQNSSVYATVSRGYRSGGYNIQMFNELLQPLMRTDIMQDVADVTIPVLEAQAMVPDATKTQVRELLQSMAQAADMDVDGTVYYKPETAWNYEVGSHLDALDGRMRLNLSAYWIETHDLQLSQLSETGMGRVTTNNGRGRSIGGEVEVQAHPTSALDLSAAYGYTHATLLHSATAEHPDDYLVPFSPAHTLSVGGRYQWQTHTWAERVSLSVSGKGCGTTYWDNDNSLAQPFYATLDARVSVCHGGLELSVWGNNLTQSHYHVFSFVTRSQNFVQMGRPLQIGVDLRLQI